MHFFRIGGINVPWTDLSNNLICCIHKDYTFKSFFIFSVSCTTVDHPKSGSVSVSTDGTTSTATFTCVSGYKLVGENIITCGEDGQWSDAIPYCGKIYLQILLILDEISFRRTDYTRNVSETWTLYII